MSSCHWCKPVYCCMIYLGLCDASRDFMTDLIAVGMATIQWRHNENDSVSNHQPHDCLFNCQFRRRWKKTSKLCVTGLCEMNSPVTGDPRLDSLKNYCHDSSDGGETRLWATERICFHLKRQAKASVEFAWQQNSPIVQWVKCITPIIYGPNKSMRARAVRNPNLPDVNMTTVCRAIDFSLLTVPLNCLGQCSRPTECRRIS